MKPNYLAIFLGIAASFILSVSSPAKASDDFGHFSIRTIEIKELPEQLTHQQLKQIILNAQPSANEPVNPPSALPDELQQAEVIIDRIINLGKKLWTIVEANKPVVEIKTNNANALPEGIGHWLNLQNWQTPKSRLYQVSYENLFGVEVINFKYRVIYTYGGSFKDQGKYLTNVTVIPAEVSVAWGYKFNAKVEGITVTNAGTATDPLAGIQLNVSWAVDTALKHGEGSGSYYMRGDGLFQDLTEGTGIKQLIN